MRMLFMSAKKYLRILSRHESGLTLLETVAATAILGVVAASLLTGLSLAAKSDFTISTMSKAEAVARSQVDHIAASSYIDYSVPSHGEYELITAPTNYTIQVSTQPIDPVNGQSLGADQDSGVQMITVTVTRPDGDTTILEGYKVSR
jgi:type II secretory pathway pseudopilin PulG